VSDSLPEDPRHFGHEWLAEARAMHGIPALEPAESPPADASDPEQIKAARREQRLAKRTIATTIHEMMQLKEVRAVVYRWLDSCGAFRDHDFPFGASIDPLQLARNAAHREVAQAITADLLGSAPEQYLLMLKEAAD
jgi:hypothetical protein